MLFRSEAPYGDFGTAGWLAGDGGDPSPIDLSGVANPLAEGMYHTLRVGDSSFTLPGLVPGATYRLRLHFVEYDTADNRFDASVNGVPVLADYSIAAAAGGLRKAVVAEVDGTADAYGNLAVVLTARSGTARIAGIEVYDGDSRVLLSDCGAIPRGIEIGRAHV